MCLYINVCMVCALAPVHLCVCVHSNRIMRVYLLHNTDPQACLKKKSSLLGQEVKEEAQEEQEGEEEEEEEEEEERPLAVIPRLTCSHLCACVCVCMCV